MASHSFRIFIAITLQQPLICRSSNLKVEMIAVLSGAAELIREVENNRATKDAFHFGKLVGDLERAGDYIVEYTLSPPRPALGQLTCSLTLHVKAGPAVEMAVQVISNSLCLMRR